jgi:hypothetical protein
LLAELQFASETHANDEGLRIVELNVEAERWLQASREGLDTLRLRECACPREQGLEPVLVLRNRAGSLGGHQFPERIGADGRPEPEVQEL